MRYAVFLAAVIILSGCGLDPVTRPENVSWSTEILPMFNQKCVNCHSSEGNSGGVNLESYVALNASLSMNSGDPVIVPGDPLNSILYQVVSTEDIARRMPYNSSALSEEEQQLIYVWIQEGAVEN